MTNVATKFILDGEMLPIGGDVSSQTPWLSDIEAASYALLHVSKVRFGTGDQPLDLRTFPNASPPMVVLGISGEIVGTTPQLGALWSSDIGGEDGPFVNQSYAGDYLSGHGGAGLASTSSYYQDAQTLGGDYFYSEMSAASDPGSGGMSRLDLNGFHIDVAEPASSVPVLQAATSESWNRMPGLVLQAQGDEVAFLIQTSEAPDFVPPYALFNMQAAVAPSVRSGAQYDVYIEDAAGFGNVTSKVYPGVNNQATVSIYSGPPVQRMTLETDSDGPRFDFTQGDGFTTIPSLSALQSVPYEGLPGLVLAPTADPSAISGGSEFLVAHGGWADYSGHVALVDVAAFGGTTNPGGEIDVIGRNGTPGDNAAAYLNAFAANSADLVLFAGGNQIHLRALQDGSQTFATTGPLTFLGPSYGFYGATPVAQHAAITDASGGATVDTEARAALNTLLAAIRSLGLIAT